VKFVSNIPQHPKGYSQQEDFEIIARAPQGKPVIKKILKAFWTSAPPQSLLEGSPHKLGRDTREQNMISGLRGTTNYAIHTPFPSPFLKHNPSLQSVMVSLPHENFKFQRQFGFPDFFHAGIRHPPMRQDSIHRSGSVSPRFFMHPTEFIPPLDRSRVL
jgi:hypothetical protein